MSVVLSDVLSDAKSAEMPDHAALARDSQAFALPGGERVIVRPIGPRDAARLQACWHAMSATSRRARFFVALAELPPRELTRITNMTAPGELALMVTTAAGEMIAEAIQVIAAGGQRCEFALSIAEGWRGRGVGTLLLRNMECRALRLGVRYLVADVLRANTAMKCFARKAGFTLHTPFTDATLVEIVKDLATKRRERPCEELFAALAEAAA